MMADRVLLVTADSRSADLVATAIEPSAHLTVVPNIETLETLREREIDTLILTDGSPTGDSLDLVREIRREFPTLPVEFVSEADSGVLASEALAAGVDDYVPMSVVSTDPDRLRSGLDRAMQARSLSDPSDELAALHTATREMVAAESTDALAKRVVEASTDVLGLEYAAVYRIDDDEATLDPVAWTEQLQELANDPASIGPDSLAWPAFMSTSTKYYADVATVDKTPTVGTVFRTEFFVPLGGHGLFSVFSPEQDDFNAREREVVSILGANATAALDSIAKTAELRETARTLQSQNEQLDRFASVVSHDLRNPLQVAEGRLELAREECPSEHLTAVAEAHSRMDTLIRDLLVLARSGQQVDEAAVVDVGTLVRECWQHVVTTDATLVCDMDIRVRADRSRLQQVFENLIRNAVEHGSTGPRSHAHGYAVEHGSTSSRTESDDTIEHGGADVTVRIGALDAGFYVEDDGPGIPEETREEVFEMGYSTTDDGTGFGLSIVEQVANAHGWSVRVTDGSEGGARFEITGLDVVE